MAFWKSAQPEYTEPTAPAAKPRPKPATAPAASAKPDRLQIADEKRNGSARKGFDPYNSGAFDTRQTWERVIRK